MKINLSYYKSAWLNYQWSILYEFGLEGFADWNSTQGTILSNLFQSKILSKNIHYDEIDKSKFEVNTEGIKRPFNFDNLEITDFDHYPNYNEYEKIIKEFSQEEDWGDDKEDFRSLVIRTDYLIRERTNFQNGFWLLNRDKLKKEKGKLDEINWIYAYWILIVEIDQTNKKIRTIDLGYD